MSEENILKKTSRDTYECTVPGAEELQLMLYKTMLQFGRKLTAIVLYRPGCKEALEEYEDKYGKYLPNYTGISYTSWNYGVGIKYEIDIKYRIGTVKLKMMEEEMKQEVDRICKLLFLPGMPAEAKILLAHNYLARTITYVKNRENPLATSYTQSAYGALIEKKCVCEGFADAFKKIMDAAGVECTMVDGQCVGSTGYHSWNTVSLGSKENTYHVDVTWDNTTGAPEYTHFCKGDKFYEGKRIWNKNLTPACPANKTVLPAAKAYIVMHKAELLKRGVDPQIIGF